MIGRTVSHYHIVGQLGSGGMGVVYSAEDQRLGRQVALKFVPEELAKDRQAIERLRSEARTASNLNHPNICTIYDVGEYEGRPFIVMELLKGQTLRERLASGQLRVHEAVELGIQVADALDSAHHRGIMHRDIKPANLFLVERGQVKILDFGLAKLVRQTASSTTTGPTRDQTAEGITLGTVAYMSPEQVTGEQLDGRTDLFSLGVVLYECLTGHQPFTGKTSAVIFSAILTRAPVAPVVFNPEMPLRLQDVINNCLEKDRELRYQDAAGLRADLKRVKRDLESGHSGTFRISGAPTTSGYSSGPRSVSTLAGHADSDQRETVPQPAPRSAAKIAAVAAAVALGLAAVVTVSYTLWSRSTTAIDDAATTTSQSLVRNRLGLATTSLEAKDYRSALGYAEEALRVAPDDQDAIRIRDAARAMIARFDAAVSKTRALLASGDADGATAALNEARAIEPSAPVLSELSAGLVALLKTQAETARREARQRPVPPPSPPPSRPSASESRAEAQRQRAGRESPPSPVPPVTTESRPGAAPPREPKPAPITPSTQVPSQPAAQAPNTQPANPPASQPVEPLQPAQPPPRPPANSEQASTPAPASAEAAQRREGAGAAPRSTPTPAPETDETMIRRVVANYARAIETKDIGLFRRVKPNLSSDEQRRIEEGFRAVTSQDVNITILSIEIHGQEASVHLSRRDTIQAGGRQQTTESQQTMTLSRNGSGWVIREIGR